MIMSMLCLIFITRVLIFIIVSCISILVSFLVMGIAQLNNLCIWINYQEIDHALYITWEFIVFFIKQVYWLSLWLFFFLTSIQIWSCMTVTLLGWVHNERNLVLYYYYLCYLELYLFQILLKICVMKRRWCTNWSPGCIPQFQFT